MESISTHPETTQCHTERSEESPAKLAKTRSFPPPCSEPALNDVKGQAYSVPRNDRSGMVAQTCPRAKRLTHFTNSPLDFSSLQGHSPVTAT